MLMLSKRYKSTEDYKRNMPICALGDIWSGWDGQRNNRPQNANSTET